MSGKLVRAVHKRLPGFGGLSKSVLAKLAVAEAKLRVAANLCAKN